MENVFVEKPFLPHGLSKEYLRWLYTAIARATKIIFDGLYGRRFQYLKL